MSHRIERVNHLIRQEISELLQRQVKDPRLGTFVIVTDVATSPDFKFARVFISRIGTKEQKEETLRALTTAAGFFRRELAKRLDLPHTPELSFHWDDSIERGDRIMQLLDQVNQEKPPTDQKKT